MDTLPISDQTFDQHFADLGKPGIPNGGSNFKHIKMFIRANKIMRYDSHIIEPLGTTVFKTILHILSAHV